MRGYTRAERKNLFKKKMKKMKKIDNVGLVYLRILNDDVLEYSSSAERPEYSTIYKLPEPKLSLQTYPFAAHPALLGIKSGFEDTSSMVQHKLNINRGSAHNNSFLGYIGLKDFV